MICRDRCQFQLLKETCCRRCIAKKEKSRRSGVIRVWSAGCSTGQDPMRGNGILEGLPDRSGLVSRVFASDPLSPHSNAHSAASIGRTS